MDDGIGVILDKLDELGISDNMIFLFVSDHGSSGKGSASQPCHGSSLHHPAGRHQGRHRHG